VDQHAANIMIFSGPSANENLRLGQFFPSSCSTLAASIRAAQAGASHQRGGVDIIVVHGRVYIRESQAGRGPGRGDLSREDRRCGWRPVNLAHARHGTKRIHAEGNSFQGFGRLHIHFMEGFSQAGVGAPEGART